MKWISVADQLPPWDETVLFYMTQGHWNRDDQYNIGEYRNDDDDQGWWDGEFLIDAAHVTHWMPLPPLGHTKERRRMDKSEWISVKDCMPPLDTEVLVVYEDIYNKKHWMDVMILYKPYRDDELKWTTGNESYGDEVKYWMPLPELPDDLVQEGKDD